ncbi:MAG: hypothetical protein LWX83_04705 [Anaerolineae bacterium]|nr:hypothetical protein [Anaerolineae bacterium]
MADDFKVVDEFPFTFYGTTFTTALGNDRKLYIPLPLMCKALFIDVDGQVQRIQRDEALSDAMRQVRFEQYPHGDDEVRAREVNALRLDRLPYWLGTIDTHRIQKEDVRAKIITFKREFADVAWDAFRTQILPHDILAELDSSLPPAQQTYLAKMDEATVLRQNLQEQNQRLGEMEKRLSGLEARFEGTDFINPAQAKQYMDMVNAIAMVLKRKGEASPHARIHGEIKHVFNVPSYALIPEKEFPRLKKYLEQLYQRVTPAGTPMPEVFRAPNQRKLL